MIALKIDAKFKGKLTGAFKNDMSNLTNFHESIGKSVIGTLMRSFYPKFLSIKFAKELCVMTIKNDAKFGAELNCRFKIWHQKFDEF